MKYKVKPTEKQLQTFQHMKKAKSLQEAMLKGGYSLSTSTHPKQKLVESAGFKTLLGEYREDLKKAGITKEVLAEIQAEGLFDQDAKVRLEYLKETKKDLGLSSQQEGEKVNLNIFNNPNFIKNYEDQ